ncbi:YlxR family protein [Mogibacterium diversum]|uniref:YlxR family protein n=1 Tax=Mogibacterium diversum TaxID=114527 RepID=UPI0028E346F5|nr:YlxR family protein [Mogibacterium diversum]
MALNENREPMRRCIGCRSSNPKIEMFRFTCRGVEIYEDITGNDEGRGVYLCKRESCIESARKNRAFNRAYKKAIDDKSLSELLEKMLEKTRR